MGQAVVAIVLILIPACAFQASSSGMRLVARLLIPVVAYDVLSLVRMQNAGQGWVRRRLRRKTKPNHSVPNVNSVCWLELRGPGSFIMPHDVA